MNDYIRKATIVPSIEELQDRIDMLEKYIEFLKRESENGPVELKVVDIYLLLDSEPIQTGINRNRPDRTPISLFSNDLT